ncbi:MAG: hypothetical protein HQL32_08925 [Planctomycetes bacterium]|nr:hypothetical protein [Planctomycetota bacterium]
MSESDWYKSIDTETALSRDEIHELLPHRGDMSFLNRVTLNEQGGIGEVVLDESAFWVPGHFPKQENNEGAFAIGPIFPGVLMVESSAQLGIVCWRHLLGVERTAGKTMLFKTIEKANFKKEARPGDRVLIRSVVDKYSIRLMRCSFEGVVLREGAEPETCFSCNIAGLSV